MEVIWNDENCTNAATYNRIKYVYEGVSSDVRLDMDNVNPKILRSLQALPNTNLDSTLWSAFIQRTYLIRRIVRSGVPSTGFIDSDSNVTQEFCY